MIKKYGYSMIMLMMIVGILLSAVVGALFLSASGNILTLDQIKLGIVLLATLYALTLFIFFIKVLIPWVRCGQAAKVERLKKEQRERMFSQTQKRAGRITGIPLIVERKKK